MIVQLTENALRQVLVLRNDVRARLITGGQQVGRRQRAIQRRVVLTDTCRRRIDQRMPLHIPLIGALAPVIRTYNIFELLRRRITQANFMGVVLVSCLILTPVPVPFQGSPVLRRTVVVTGELQVATHVGQLDRTEIQVQFCVEFAVMIVDAGRHRIVVDLECFRTAPLITVKERLARSVAGSADVPRSKLNQQVPLLAQLPQRRHASAGVVLIITRLLRTGTVRCVRVKNGVQVTVAHIRCPGKPQSKIVGHRHVDHRFCTSQVVITNLNAGGIIKVILRLRADHIDRAAGAALAVQGSLRTPEDFNAIHVEERELHHLRATNRNAVRIEGDGLLAFTRGIRCVDATNCDACTATGACRPTKRDIDRRRDARQRIDVLNATLLQGIGREYAQRERSLGGRAFGLFSRDNDVVQKTSCRAGIGTGRRRGSKRNCRRQYRASQPGKAQSLVFPSIFHGSPS